MKLKLLPGKIWFLVILLLPCFLFSKCKKEDPLPEYYIKCKIDGIDYLPNNCANCMRSQLLGDTVFLMNANAEYQTVLIGVTNKPNFIEGNYILISPMSGGAFKNSTITSDRYDTDSIRTGVLNIKTLDKIKKICEGTFYFQAFNRVRNKTVNITEGKFRLKYTIN